MFTGNKNGPCFKARDDMFGFSASGDSSKKFGDYQMRKYSPEVWVLKRHNESWFKYFLRRTMG